jgi:uncharacterized protein DUF2188
MTNTSTNGEQRNLWAPSGGIDIHVGRGESGAWLVTRGGQRTELASYRLRDHAMAFARAVAFSRHVEMIVHDLNGRGTLHKRASLTYPVSLD